MKTSVERFFGFGNLSPCLTSPLAGEAHEYVNDFSLWQGLGCKLSFLPSLCSWFG